MARCLAAGAVLAGLGACGSAPKTGTLPPEPTLTVGPSSTTRGGPGGAIVNVSSSAATLGSPHEYVHYAAAKAGIEALTVGLAKELADQGVRVNAVAPGMIRTALHAAAGDPDRLQRVLPRIPMG